MIIPTDFTPFQSLAGGMLIGIAAAGFWIMHGRIFGISGLITSLLSKTPNKDNLLVIVGIITPFPIFLVMGKAPEISIATTSSLLIILSGLLTGIGVYLGSGCTSGHGICGLSRLSLRSLVATASFMTMAVITTYILRHGMGGT